MLGQGKQAVRQTKRPIPFLVSKRLTAHFPTQSDNLWILWKFLPLPTLRSTLSVIISWGKKKKYIYHLCLLFSPNPALVEGYPSKQDPWTAFVKMTYFNQSSPGKQKEKQRQRERILPHSTFFFCSG